MTTTVQSTVSHRSFRIYTLSGGAEISVVFVDGRNPNHPTSPLDLDRAEFLAAVATELNVLVIPRTDLPKVKRLYGVTYAVGGDESTHSAATAEYARERAIGYLAVAEYLDAHPPIDQAQVAALATLLRDTGARPNGADTIPIARRLVQAGVTVGGAS